MSDASDAPLLSLRGINKSFGAVHVLRDVDLDVRAGRVTALVGDNGLIVQILGDQRASRAQIDTPLLVVELFQAGVIRVAGKDFQ